MDDMRAMMQDELRQALSGLLPPLATTIVPAVELALVAISPVTANPYVEDVPPANNDNIEGQPLNAARNMPTINMKFEDDKNYIVEKAKKESLQLVQDLESK